MIDTAYWQANLEPHGWGVERDLDGSLLLIPGAVDVQTAAVAPSISPRQEILRQTDLAWLRDRLSPHGWGVERDLDGSLLLTPGAVDVQTVAIVPSISPRQEIPGQTDLAWLRDRLSPHGWGVERDLDGSVLLTPGAVDVQTVVVNPSASPHYRT
jgi:alpha-D-ribose 1-methylphosphonate 5-triphosphate diphosphatase PhnM